jgi:drug/metabolite transporter (DMT)-like permease
MWIIFSILAAVFWGFDYVFAEQVTKKISVYSFLAIQLLFAFFITLLISIFTGFLKIDLLTIASSRQMLVYLSMGIAAFTAGNLFILASLQAKNATLAGMIEISYPLFIALFVYLIFKENQLNLATLFGALLIFLGVFVIYFFNR